MREVACLFVKPPLLSVAATLQLQPCAAGDAYTCFSLGTLRGHQRKKTGLWEPLFGSFRMWLSGVAVANSLFSPADCRLALLFHSNNRNVQKPVGNFRFYHAFMLGRDMARKNTRKSEYSRTLIGSLKQQTPATARAETKWRDKNWIQVSHIKWQEFNYLTH